MYNECWRGLVLVFSVVSAVFHQATATNCTSQSKSCTFVVLLVCIRKTCMGWEWRRGRERWREGGRRGDREGEKRRRRKLRKWEMIAVCQEVHVKSWPRAQWFYVLALTYWKGINNTDICSRTPLPCIGEKDYQRLVLHVLLQCPVVELRSDGRQSCVRGKHYQVNFALPNTVEPLK